MSSFKSCAAVICVGLVLAVSSGCIAAAVVGGAAAGAGGAVWYDGALRTSVAAPMDKTKEAASATLQKLGSGVVASHLSSEGDELTYSTLDSKEVTIKLKAVNADVTEISIRVGFWGDEIRSRQILEDVRQRLGKAG